MLKKVGLRGGLIGASLVVLLLVTQVFSETPSNRPKGDISGIVVTGSGHPVFDAVVDVKKTDARIPVIFVRTDARGRFNVTGLEVGKYIVHALVRGMGEVTVECKVETNRTTSVRLVMPTPI